MKNPITLIHSTNGASMDITHLVTSIKLSGRITSPTRQLTVTLLDEIDKAQHFADIDPMRGDQVIFLYEGVELFRGMWMKAQRSDSLTQVATAYDLGIYLSNNKDTFCYENPVSASDVFADVCSRFGIPMGASDDTGHKVEDYLKSKCTGWDAVGKILEQTYDATGKRFAIYAERGFLRLVERQNNVKQWVIESGVNLLGYNRGISTEKIRTRIKVYDKDDVVQAEAKNTGLEAKIGRFQDIDSVRDDGDEEPNAQAVANTALENSCKPDRSMSVTARGIPEVISGVGIYVRIRKLGFEQVCYVDEDTHTWDERSYSMSLKLTPAE